MQPSSLFCRTQEARQHALATGATLANARGVATLAAAAWAKEALAAEKREQRKARARAEAGTELCLAMPPTEDRAFDADADGDFADAGAIRR